MKIISKIKDKNVEGKFAKFVTYFKQSMKSKPKTSHKSEQEMNKDEEAMLEEIANFVSSKDFNKFFKKCKFIQG